MVQESTLALVSEADSALDTLTADSVGTSGQPSYGILLTPPEQVQDSPLRDNGSLGVSFILAFLFILFFIIALRFRNNVKYITAIFRNLIEVRTRSNVFNDTVSEASLIVLLNLLWISSAGIVGFSVMDELYGDLVILSRRVIGMLWGMAVAAVYTLFMLVAYASVGWVFSDKKHSALWVRGYTASQALAAPAFFVMALIGICRPETSLEVGIVSALVFILVKIVFIWKGYRIFFNQISSWVLFLCYLCSLEIVPLILCYRSAVLLVEVF